MSGFVILVGICSILAIIKDLRNPGKINIGKQAQEYVSVFYDRMWKILGLGGWTWKILKFAFWTVLIALLTNEVFEMFGKIGAAIIIGALLIYSVIKEKVNVEINVRRR
jgi:hypothetical protein